MKIILVEVEVKPEYREQFIEATKKDASSSVEFEEGCLRFDFLQYDDDPNVFYLYEVYRDAAAFRAHQEAPHFLLWRDTVDDDWLVDPADVAQCTNIWPPDVP